MKHTNAAFDHFFSGFHLCSKLATVQRKAALGASSRSFEMSLSSDFLFSDLQTREEEQHRSQLSCVSGGNRSYDPFDS